MNNPVCCEVNISFLTLFELQQEVGDGDNVSQSGDVFPDRVTEADPEHIEEGGAGGGQNAASKMGDAVSTPDSAEGMVD